MHPVKEILLYCLLAILCLIPASPSFAGSGQYVPRAGDLLFQSLPHSELTDAIEGITDSPYSHVGLVVAKAKQWYVREAMGAVVDTPLQDWIARGREQRFDVYRFGRRYQKQVPALIAESAKFLGRPYDFQYVWDDAEIYCSELIYKAFFNASGIRLGNLRKLGEMNWQPYAQIIEQKLGKPVPLERLIITPRDLTNASAISKVYSR